MGDDVLLLLLLLGLASVFLIAMVAPLVPMRRRSLASFPLVTVSLIVLNVFLFAATSQGGALTEEVARGWGLTSERMAMARPGAPVLHPGPTNEGVEISAELASSPRSLIGRQVENGVATRMAVLALLAA